MHFFLYKFTEFEWTYFLFLDETAIITLSEVLKVWKSSENVMWRAYLLDIYIDHYV